MTNSFLYVPVLLAAAALLNQADVDQWQNDDRSGDWWSALVDRLSRATIDLESFRERIEPIALTCPTTRRFMEQVIRDTVGQHWIPLRNAVASACRYDGYIEGEIQEILLAIYGGDEVCRFLNTHADTYRENSSRNPVPAHGHLVNETMRNLTSEIAGHDSDQGPTGQEMEDDPPIHATTSDADREEQAFHEEEAGNHDLLTEQHALFLPCLDALDLNRELEVSVPTLRYVPSCIRGKYIDCSRNILGRLSKAYDDRRRRDRDIQRGWKLWLLLPRMLLHRLKEKGAAAKSEMHKRFHWFEQGRYQDLLRQGAIDLPRGPARQESASKINIAERLVQSGQLSRAAKILTSPGLAPGDSETLRQLIDPSKRPPHLLAPIPDEVLEFRAERIKIDAIRFPRVIRRTRTGSAPGPSGMRIEHLKPLLEDNQCIADLIEIADHLANADVPEDIRQAICLCRIVALRKGSTGISEAHGPSSRVRGLAVGDVMRRLVSRTLVQQYQSHFETKAGPYQFGIASRSGVDAAVHLLRSLTDQDGRATITQIDGVGAFDHMSRRTMLSALRETPEAKHLLPYVLMSYGNQSRYIWTDEAGVNHPILQGEGGEQGDPLMPSLFSIGISTALQQAQSQLQPDELLIAYLDDIYIITRPERALAAYDTVTAVLKNVCGIEANLGKTVCWNRAGIQPAGIERLGSEIWRGGRTAVENGIKVLGSPIGTHEFCTAFGHLKAAETRTMCEAFAKLDSAQAAWLLTYFCAVPRINHILRQVPPSVSLNSGQAHDAVIDKAVADLLSVDPAGPHWNQCRTQARLPIRLGGLGLRDSPRTAKAAYWASWADVLPSLISRFPNYAGTLSRRLEDRNDSVSDVHCIHELKQTHDFLLEQGFAVAPWSDVVRGHPPPRPDPDQEQASSFKHGWQGPISVHLEKEAAERFLGSANPETAARFRASQGPHASDWLTACPIDPSLQIANPLMQCMMRRRLGLPITHEHLTCEARSCRHELDTFGHHRMACTRTGRIHGRHAAAINPWRRVLFEAGYKLSVERLLRDTTVSSDPRDRRRMDIVASPGNRSVGAFRGIPLFCDITVVSPITRSGVVRGRSHREDGWNIRQAENKKNQTYRDVAQAPCAKFLTLGCDVYGRWSADSLALINELARLKAREAPPPLRKTAQHAWIKRWFRMTSVGLQKAVAEAMLTIAGPDMLSGLVEASPPCLAELVDERD